MPTLVGNHAEDTSTTKQEQSGRIFASLRVRNYRLYATGQIVSLFGTWMQRIAQDWLVLRLTDDSPIALGIAAALQFGPALLLTLYGGLLADRVDKRRLLIILQSGLAGCALVLGLLDVTGTVQLWHVYGLCLILGCFAALDVPVRQAFVSEMVGRENLANAVALNAMTFNLARIAGPSLAGVLITISGTGWVFLINVLTFGAVLVAMVRMNPDDLHRSPSKSPGKGQLREAMRYVRKRTDIVVTLALMFMVSTFGLNFFVTLAIIIRTEFHLNSDAYGWLSAALAVGTLIGATLAARRAPGTVPSMRLLVIAASAFGVLEILAGLAPSAVWLAVALIPTGVAAAIFTTSANSITQLGVSSEMRGRVMGLYMLLFLGSAPIGAPALGWLAEQAGGRMPIIIGGVMSTLPALVCGWFHHRHLRKQVKLG